jgi:hypothetical protein
VTVSPGFADRVVRAAVAEAQKQQVALAPSRQSARRRLAIATGAVAALAASLLLFLRPWQATRLEPGPVVVKTDPIENRVPIENTVPIENAVEKTVAKVVAIKDQFLAALVATAPSDSEAVVLRVRVGKDVRLSEALDAALNKVGISPLASDASSAAVPWQESYRRLLETKYGSTAGGPNEKLLTSTVAAAEALFIEAPLERVDAALAALSETVKQPLAINAEGKLVLARGPNTEKGEGEFAVSQPFAQRLNAGLFRLEKKLADAATAAVSSPTASAMKPQQLVRVLILVETD